jgi:hypothetical protein
MILTKEEKEKEVIELYFNQKKPYRYISQILRMSLRDISAIIKREEQKRHPSITTAETKDEIQQPCQIEVAAYKLFSEGKDPVQVAIELNITQQDVTLFQRGYWKLKQLDQLNEVYEHTNGNLLPFLELYELARKDGLSTEQVVKAVKIASGKLPYIEFRYKECQNQVERLESKTLTLQNEIAYQKQVLESYNRYCDKQRQEIEKLYNQKKEVEEAVTVATIKFKDINKEDAKIRYTDEQRKKSISSDRMEIVEAGRRAEQYLKRQFCG